MSLRSSVIVQTPKSVLPAFAEKKKPLIEVLDEEPPLARVATKEFKQAPSGLGAFSAVSWRRQAAPRRRSNKKTTCPSLPPNLNIGGRQILSARLRYDVTATVSSQAIPDYALMAGVGCIATTSTTLATIASAVRLRRITLWPSAGGEATIYWSPAPSAGPGQPDVGNDSSIPTGITVDKPVSSTPPKESMAFFWHNPTSATPVNLAKISATSGTIIDVEVDFTLCRAVVPEVLSVAGPASVNAFYAFYLDGTSSHKLQPLAVPAIF